MKRLLIFLVIILSSSKQTEIKESIENGSQKNNTIEYPPYPKQPLCIEYYVENDSARENIKFVFDTFNLASSCLCFNMQYTRIEHKIGINFFSHNGETNVTLSTNKSMPTNVYLNKEASTNLKKAAFGVGLALGFIPEVSRNDRDDNIDIYWGNLSTNYKEYYSQKVITNTSTGFDFTSTMLYDFNFGAETGKDAFGPKLNLKPYYKKMLENIRYTISHNDKRRVNELYCSDLCKDKPQCENGGYYSDKYCNFCTCPPEFKGQTCTQMDNENCDYTRTKIHNSTEEGGDLQLTDFKKKCIFLIQTNDNNSKIATSIKTISFDETFIKDIDRYVEIKYRDDKGTKGLVIYQNVSDITLPSLSDKVYVIVNDNSGNFQLDIEYHNNVTKIGQLVSGIKKS